MEMDIQLEGVLDWGDLYAAQTFLDDSGRRLMWGTSPFIGLAKTLLREFSIRVAETSPRLVIGRRPHP